MKPSTSSPEVTETAEELRSSRRPVLTFDDYQHRARLFEQTPQRKTTLAINRAVFGLVGEIGKIAEYLKKAGYEKKEQFDIDRVVDELGDVLWYMAALVDALSVTLSSVADQNLRKLSGRYVSAQDLTAPILGPAKDANFTRY